MRSSALLALRLAHLAILCCLLGIGSVEAAATPAVEEDEPTLEWQVDLYGGLTFPDISHLSLDSTRTGFAGSQSIPATVSGEMRPMGGLRLTAWIPKSYVGVGIDQFYINPTLQVDTPAVTIPAPSPCFGTCFAQTLTPAEHQKFSFSVIGLGIDVLRFRWPLAVSAQHPSGQFRPYLAAGPAILYVQGKQTSNLIGETSSSGTPELGVKAGVGFDLEIEKNVSLRFKCRSHFGISRPLCCWWLSRKTLTR